MRDLRAQPSRRRSARRVGWLSCSSNLSTSAVWQRSRLVGRSWYFRQLLRMTRFKRADINETVHYARKPAAVALVVEERRIESIGIKVGIAGVDGRAVGEERMRHRRPTVVLQWADVWVGVANIAWTVEQTAGAGRAVSACGIAAEVVA